MTQKIFCQKNQYGFQKTPYLSLDWWREECKGSPTPTGSPSCCLTRFQNVGSPDGPLQPQSKPSQANSYRHIDKYYVQESRLTSKVTAYVFHWIPRTWKFNIKIVKQWSHNITPPPPFNIGKETRSNRICLNVLFSNGCKTRLLNCFISLREAQHEISYGFLDTNALGPLAFLPF